MNVLTPFVVLIERRPLRTPASWIKTGAALLLSAVLLASAPPLRAQTAASKIAADLQQVIAAPLAPSLNWVKSVNGVRLVKVLVVSNSPDPDLAALRADVLARGGSVYFRYTSVRALSAMLPAGQVASIAARSDVTGVSPNRMTARTASFLENTTGVSNLRTSTSTTYSGLDGTGIGLAVLDSGVMFRHASMMNAAGKTRVVRAVNLTKPAVGDATAVGLRNWAAGADASASLYPGSATMANYETLIKSDGVNRPDPYGHGTHVAAMAAGRGLAMTTDSTGVAPNANVYDVRVLDKNGFGQLSDVLAGIDWVIYHAKEFNIRVMNLSLAADSTESHLTDPLAVAVRSATAAGITVVVAAGNFGQTTTGAERYGTISSPGHEPSVITVGSSNS